MEICLTNNTSFMIDGIDGDDRYRMVEDEFLATAHQFTAHLHAAEYKRLKATSELENAQTIRNISRPVVGQKTDLVKMKEERKSLAEKQRLATRKLYKGNASGDESTDDEDKNDSWQRQSLHGLMESPGKRAKHLGGLPSATSVTRAAAGFNRQSTVVSPRRPKLKPLQLSGHNLTYHQRRGSGNDLETSTGYRIAHRSPPLVTTAPRAEAPRISGVSKLQFGNSGKTTEDPRSVTPIVAEKTATADDDDLDIMARLKKRQEERRRNREQRRSTTHGSDVKSNLDDILPGFL